jgi:hypothetical protein
MYGLPTFRGQYSAHGPYYVSSLTEDNLARYLQFYNIGSEVIEEGAELKIKSGMLADARELLVARIRHVGSV